MIEPNKVYTREQFDLLLKAHKKYFFEHNTFRLKKIFNNKGYFKYNFLVTNIQVDDTYRSVDITLFNSLKQTIRASLPLRTLKSRSRKAILEMALLKRRFKNVLCNINDYYINYPTRKRITLFKASVTNIRGFVAKPILLVQKHDNKKLKYFYYMNHTSNLSRYLYNYRFRIKYYKRPYKKKRYRRFYVSGFLFIRQRKRLYKIKRKVRRINRRKSRRKRRLIKGIKKQLNFLRTNTNVSFKKTKTKKIIFIKKHLEGTPWITALILLMSKYLGFIYLFYLFGLVYYAVFFFFYQQFFYTILNWWYTPVSIFLSYLLKYLLVNPLYFIVVTIPYYIITYLIIPVLRVFIKNISKIFKHVCILLVVLVFGYILPIDANLHYPMIVVGYLVFALIWNIPIVIKECVAYCKNLLYKRQIFYTIVCLPKTIIGIMLSLCLNTLQNIMKYLWAHFCEKMLYKKFV